MCGIAGFWGGNKDFHMKGDAERLLQRMIDSIRHRGPDAEGIFHDPENSLILGHRRLSIQDISTAGAQPMESKTGRYCISYNGEIYNHLEIREELNRLGININWRGLSDTETLLNAIDFWGLDTSLRKVVGMFAFALWDREKSKLILARDRFGEKPLYYSWQGGSIAFASELKPIELFPSFDKSINHAAVQHFISYKFIPAPHSIWRNVSKVKPATYIEIDLRSKSTLETNYWDHQRLFYKGLSNPTISTRAVVQHQVEGLIRGSVGNQLLSDVSVGAFLSGGIDSTLVTMLMQQESTEQVNTFSIGVGDNEFNEAAAARKIANILETNHTEFQVEPRDVLSTIPELFANVDEPFADSSLLVTHLISKLARQSVTVALTGDGGDEIFCGYNRYIFAHKYWSLLLKIPLKLRSGVSRCLTSIPSQFWIRILATLGKENKLTSSYVRIPEKIAKIAQALEQRDRFTLYNSFVNDTNLDNNPCLNIGKQFSFESICERKDIPIEDYLMYLDTQFYLPGDILTKSDRASMAASLETRTPFLDHRLVEYSWTIPINMKIKDGKSKSILREILYSHFDKEVIDRPKMGFAVPLREWLIGPLRGIAEENLSEKALKEAGLLDAKKVKRIWQEHLSGKRDHHSILWSIISLQIWHSSRF